MPNYCRLLGTKDEDFLPVQMVYNKKHPTVILTFLSPQVCTSWSSPTFLTIDQWRSPCSRTKSTYIIVPYVAKMQKESGDNRAALVIMGNFKGQVTVQVNDHLEGKNILVELLPANTTDLFQPTNISVN